DARGRVTSVVYPAFGTEPTRTVTNTYKVGNNPLVTSTGDSAGTVTTTVDLLGRVTSYTDVWAKTTPTTYDQAGRVTDTSGPPGAQHFDYDNSGRLTSQKLDTFVVATPTYDIAGELGTVTYPSGGGSNGGNGTTLTVNSRDAAGRVSKVTWTLAGAQTVVDTV